MVRGKSLLPFLALISLTAQAAIDEKEFAKCALSKGDLEKLACFDRLAKANKIGVSGESKTAGGPNSQWDIQTNVNPIDDTKIVTLGIEADVPGARRGRGVFMLVRCKSSETDVILSWNDYLGGDERMPVLIRVGSSEARTESWSMSSNSKSTFAPNPVELLKEMMKSNKFVAQTTPFNESPKTAIFNTSGLETAIKPLREVCKW